MAVYCQETTSFQATETQSDISIDGNLNEDQWQQSIPVTDFRQLDPVEGESSTRRTEVRLLFGRDDLYVGTMMYDNPEAIEKNLGRRDGYNKADWFMVSIDSYFNRRTAYTFAVNAAGVQLDGQQDDNKKLSISNADPTLPVGLDP